MKERQNRRVVEGGSRIGKNQFVFYVTSSLICVVKEVLLVSIIGP